MAKTLFLVTEATREQARVAPAKKRRKGKSSSADSGASRSVLTYDVLAKQDYEPLQSVDNVVAVLSPAAALRGKILRRAFNELGIARGRTLTIIESEEVDEQETPPTEEVDPRKLFTDLGRPEVLSWEDTRAGGLLHGAHLLRYGLQLFVDDMFRRYFGVYPRDWGTHNPPPPVAAPGFAALGRYVSRHGPSHFGFVFKPCETQRGTITADHLAKHGRTDIPLVYLGKTENTCARAIKRGACVWALVRLASAGLEDERDVRDLEETSARLLRWAGGKEHASSRVPAQRKKRGRGTKLMGKRGGSKSGTGREPRGKHTFGREETQDVGFYSYKQLAEKHGLPEPALRKRVDRFLADRPDLAETAKVPLESRKRGEPWFLLKEKRLLHVIEGMKEERYSRTT